MKRRFDHRTARGLSTAAVLALVLAGCSSGGGGGDGDGDSSDAAPIGGGSADPEAGGSGDGSSGGGGAPGGLGGLAGAAQPADDDVVSNPFQTGGGTRPGTADDDAADDDAGDDDDLGDDDGSAQAPGGGGGNLANPFGGGADALDDDDGDEPAVPAGGAVLGRLQNGIDGEDLEDLWICEAPQVDSVQAVGYVFVQSQGILIIAPADGSDASAVLFDVSESVPGTLVNTYAEVDVVESITDFRFAGEDEFSARSDLVGTLRCQRFFTDGSGGGSGGGGTEPPVGGGAVSGRLQNELTADNQLATAWICQGPQAGADALVYAFIDGQGVFAALSEGQDPDIQPFTYTESSPGTLDLAYENGDAERLDGFAFASDGEYSVTSSFDGPLTCQLAEIN